MMIKFIQNIRETQSISYPQLFGAITAFALPMLVGEITDLLGVSLPVDPASVGVFGSPSGSGTTNI